MLLRFAFSSAVVPAACALHAPSIWDNSSGVDAVHDFDADDVSDDSQDAGGGEFDILSVHREPFGDDRKEDEQMEHHANDDVRDTNENLEVDEDGERGDKAYRRRSDDNALNVDDNTSDDDPSDDIVNQKRDVLEYLLGSIERRDISWAEMKRPTWLHGGFVAADDWEDAGNSNLARQHLHGKGRSTAADSASHGGRRNRRNLVVVELANLDRYRLQFLSMLYPSWQAVGFPEFFGVSLLESENYEDEEAFGHGKQVVTLDLAVFTEAGSHKFVPSRCQKNFQLNANFDVHQIPEDEPQCWHVEMGGDYTVDDLGGYVFEPDYAYLADPQFAALAQHYDHVLRIDADSILGPGARSWSPAPHSVVVGADFMGTHETALILRSIRAAAASSFAAQSALGHFERDDDGGVDGTDRLVKSWEIASLLSMASKGSRWVPEGLTPEGLERKSEDSPWNRTWSVVGLTDPDTCCPPDEPSGASCFDVDSKDCKSRTTPNSHLVIYHQDAVYMPGFMAGRFGSRWANLSMQLWNHAFTNETCKQFSRLLQKEDDKVCQWPIWHRPMSAVYALNMVLGQVRRGELIEPTARIRPTAKPTKRLDVPAAAACTVPGDVVHISMLDGKHSIGFVDYDILTNSDVHEQACNGDMKTWLTEKLTPAGGSPSPCTEFAAAITASAGNEMCKVAKRHRGFSDEEREPNPEPQSEDLLDRNRHQ
eukprot:TRINITY_DN48575_c0_g1_i1.p1 TRINITY_DN48575_c0_g1~~TRINITY_DN48575_c0_g1_i1.p1  ORF type:complete len:708 (-),score=122.98 TRINITY_DN48575_c0_g1_i1:79-2202(-)